MVKETEKEVKKKEYTDFDDMKNIFQYTHRRMGLGFAEDQFGESKGVVKGITKKQLVGADFDDKKKREHVKKMKEANSKKEVNQKDKVNQDGSKDTVAKSDGEEETQERKSGQIQNKKKHFEVEIKTSKKKNKQKTFKII